MPKIIRSKIPIAIYSNKKLLLALEYGLIIADVAKNQGVELKKDDVILIEKMLLNEFKHYNSKDLAFKMIPNILSCFETK